MADRAGFENRCAPCGHRGFESRPLRFFGVTIGDDTSLSLSKFLSIWDLRFLSFSLCEHDRLTTDADPSLSE